MAEKKEVREKAYSSDHELSSDIVEGQKWKGNYALKKEAKDEPIRIIKVTKIPDGAVEETLINYFENMRRNGGGPIESIEYHPATSSAIIEFEEADAVDRVLKKRPLLFLKRQISVEEYVEKVEEEEEEEPSCRTVEVCGFAENTLEDVLEMYFENSKRSGGSEVTSVVIEGGVALVTFTDENVASSVCEREHILGGRKLSVSLHLPKKKSSAVDTGREEEEAEEPVYTVEVRGYKVGSEGTVELYFENTKRSGGDEIVNFDPINSDGVIFITFASEEVAKRVSERQHFVAGCTLDVKLYEPPKRKFTRKWSKICSKRPEESVPHCVITVKGVTRRIIEPMPLYFENKRRSGGDEIVKFEYSEENEIAYITYESEEVARRVVTHGQHRLDGQPLKVKLFIPPQPRPHYEDRVLFVRLNSKITCDGLTNFLEAKIGLTPAEFFFGEERDKVIIRFNEKIDFEKLEEACKKRPLEGSYLVPSKVHISNSIIISNLKNTTTEDTIELYFENEKRSWGGPVEKVEFKREEEYCLVFFEDHTICDQVLKQKHKIDGSELHVSIYYESLGRISEDENGPSFKAPKPAKLEGLEFAKMQFLMKLVACNSGMIQLIQKRDNNEVDQIAKDLAQFYVQITIQSKEGFLVKGNQEGINQATDRLQQLVFKINHRDHELIKPGIAQYMESKGREHISAVENQIPCVIRLKEQEQYGFGKNEKETDMFGGSKEQAPRKLPMKLQTGRPELTATVWIDVYAWDKRTLDNAINKLDNLIKNDFSKAGFLDPVVKNFSHTQVSALQRLADQSRIQLIIDPKIGRITIEGIADGIMKVSDSIHRLIREADKKEQDKRSAELLKKLVQWHYIEITTESSELREYPADVNLLIETAYRDNKPFVTFFTNDGEECQIDFSKMEDCPVKDPSDSVTVVRKDLIQEMAFTLFPATWAKMAPNENLKVVNLQSTDKEYQDVQQKFLPSVGRNRTIFKLERIQNRTLYQQYEAKKKLIEQNNPGHQNESSLWHGTNVDSVDSISMHGFNRSYCSKNATVFGDGVYFAKNASYSASDTYSRPDSTGSKKMYLCRVLTGQYTTGKQGMRFPPSKPGGNVNNLYNSVVNNTMNPEIFVIFSDTQAIPEYLITFK